MSGLDIIYTIILAGFIINVGLGCIVVFFERRKPASTWAWLLVMLFIPIFGFLLYLVFGKDSRKEKIFKLKAQRDLDTYRKFIFSRDKFSSLLEGSPKDIDIKDNTSDYNYLQDLAYLHVNSGSWMTTDNSVTHFTSGEKKFHSLVDDIRKAKSFIHMEYYIFRNDNLGKLIVNELTKKAKEGVEVRLLYDGMGGKDLPFNFFSKLKAAGGEVVPFIPPFIIRINYRNHRKLCIIDGEIGYIGGFNIGDEYLGKQKRYGHWLDAHIKISGSAVTQLQLRFIMDWNYISKTPIDITKRRYFPVTEKCGNVKMQIVSSGPDTLWENIKFGYFKMINEAEKNIYIETPYFVPDDSIFESLRVAALSGCDVRIIIPANPDHPFVYWASMSYLGQLLPAGVKCYQYRKGFIHSKTVHIDGLVTSVGSANMDIRSFALNFETNAFIYDKEITRDFEDDFFAAIEDSEEITLKWYNNRSFFFKFKEAVSRLISPML